MLSLVTVALAGLAWLALMFGEARYGARRPTAFARHWRHIYTLSLAVHCTSWTFYGTVTSVTVAASQASRPSRAAIRSASEVALVSRASRTRRIITPIASA